MLELSKDMLEPNKDLVFDEETHSYFYHRRRMNSVTQLLKKYNPPFDADKWSDYVAKKEGKTQDEVKATWQKRSKESCRVGTLIHKYAECLILKKQVPSLLSEKEINLGLSIQQFIEDSPDYEVIGVELPLVCPEWGLAGTVDLIIKHKISGVILILDIKTGSKLNKENGYGTKLLYPLVHLDDCELIKYSLQIGLYARMLKRQYNLESIDTGKLVWVLAEGYDLIHCLELNTEIDIVLKDLIKNR